MGVIFDNSNFETPSGIADGSIHLAQRAGIMKRHVEYAVAGLFQAWTRLIGIGTAFQQVAPAAAGACS